MSALEHIGAQVVIVDRAGRAGPRVASRATYVGADLLDRDAVRSALDGVDVVYHLAWSGLPRSSNEDPSAHAASNLMPTLALFDACVNSSVKRIVFLSSGGAVYGRAVAFPMTEEHPTHPISAYGVAKLAVEAYLDVYWRQYDLDYVVLRPSVPYGESQNTSRGQGAVGVFLQSAMTGKPITLWGGASVSRDFFYVGDLAKACLAAADMNVQRGVYNIGGGRAITLGQLIALVERLTNTQLNTITVPPSSCDPPSILLDISKARRHLGWEPEVEIEAGVELTWEWFRLLQRYEERPLELAISSH